MAFRERRYRDAKVESLLGKPKYAGGNFFVYDKTKLNDVLSKTVKGIFVLPESYIELSDGTKIAWFGKDVEVHIWKD